MLDFCFFLFAYNCLTFLSASTFCFHFPLSFSFLGVCTRRGATLQSICTAYGPLSGSRYVNTVRVAKSPGASPSTVTAYLTPNLNYFYVSSIDGSVKTYVNGSIPDSVFPEPYFNTTSCTCENVLFGVSYTLTNELSGSVSAAYVQAILSNIQGDSTQEGCGPVNWNQKYQVTWNTVSLLLESIIPSTASH